MYGRAPVTALQADRPTPDDEPATLTDLLLVFSWPPTSSARSYPARVARALAAKLSSAHLSSPAWTCCTPDLVSAVLTGLASRGAHVLVVSTDGDAAAAELRGLGLHRHVHGAALDVRNLAEYLLDHRCRRDRAVFVGHRERDLATAARAGYEIVGLCDSAAGKALVATR
jgi:phosphoglycolate phosphatase-like HAD superfamily hydrolase